MYNTKNTPFFFNTTYCNYISLFMNVSDNYNLDYEKI